MIIHDRSIYTNADGTRKFWLLVWDGKQKMIEVVDQHFRPTMMPYDEVVQLIESKRLLPLAQPN